MHARGPAPLVDGGSGFAKTSALGALRLALIGGCVVWTLIIGLLIAWSLARSEETIRELARTEATKTIETDFLYRRWATGHGGVYVPVTEKTPPNPYLNVPERDLVTPSGRRLTLVNPAYMTRQVHELAAGSTRVHITSLRPTNPVNAPDAWDRAALERFERGSQEVAEVTDQDGKEALRVLRPMFVQEGCLRCHAAQGYQVGDVRGGLGVIVSLEPYRQIQRLHQGETLLGHATIWALGLGALVVVGRLVRRRTEERERTTRELRAREEQLRIVADFTADWEYWRGADGRMLYVSPACEAVTGFTREEFTADPELLRRIAHPDDRVFFEHLEHFEEEDERFDFRIVRKDGEVRWVTHTCRAVHGEDGEFLGRRASNRDVTEARRQSDLLHENELRLRESQRVSRVGSYVLDASTCAWTSSEVLDEILGIGADYPRDLPGLLQLIHPDARAAFSLHLREEVLAKGAPLDREYTINRIANGELRRVHCRGVPEQDAEGRVVRVSGTLQDITERKLLEDRLLHAQKMEAVGQLAGGVAHDFNNILAAILMQTGLLQGEPGLTPDMKEGLDDIETAAHRAADLTRQLLLFGRRQVMRVECLELNALLSNLLKMLTRLIGETIELRLEASPLEIWVEADPGMLEQMVLNLCVNARDAMPGGGKLVLATRRVEPADASASGAVVLSVADTGHGMDTHTLQHLFEPFFTTKAHGKGSGLGLAIVHGIVQQHHGKIEVESVSGKGTTFRVTLPLTKEDAIERRAQVKPETRGGSESVLLVEDEPQLRHLVAGGLRKLGYRVVEACDGQDATGAWARASGSFDLVLTDMMMPGGVSGLELVRQLRRARPQLCAILMSGYSLEMVGAKPPEEEDIWFVAKPFEVGQLGRVVRECLDAAKAAPAIATVPGAVRISAS